MATVVSIFCILASFIISEAAKEQAHGVRKKLAEETARKEKANGKETVGRAEKA